RRAGRLCARWRRPCATSWRRGAARGLGAFRPQRNRDYFTTLEEIETMKIAVIGTGYVGLVTGTCFADCGNDVACIDKDQAKIALLQGGGIPIYEPGLEEMVQRNSGAGRLWFTTDLAEGIKGAQLVFIAVGTPQSDTGAADLTGVFGVADQLAEKINGPKVVVIKSTVPVGTNRQVAERIAAKCKHPVD